MIFIGTAQLIRQTTLQTSLFKDWITQSRWRNFWGSGEHFDWWAFPIDITSDRHGDRYNVTPAIAELRSDPEFLHAVLENAQLFANGLGYDLVTGQVIDPTRADHYAVVQRQQHPAPHCNGNGGRYPPAMSGGSEAHAGQSTPVNSANHRPASRKRD
jgi:hypothetical protein